MKNNSNRNDKIFDIILEESFDKYSKDTSSFDIDFQMSEEEIKAMEDKEKSIHNKLMKGIDSENRKHISVKKICILVAVLLLGIICASFAVSAVHTWIQRTHISQDGTEIIVTTQKLIFEDYNNIRNFENKNVIIIPNWLPEGMELNKIDDDVHCVNFYYKNNDKFMTLSTLHGYSSTNVKIDTENNNTTIREANVLGMRCKIITMTNELGYVAHSVFWNSNDAEYEMMTNVSEEELNKILANLIYFEE